MKSVLFKLCWVLGLAAASLAQAGEVFLETFKSTAIGRDYAYTVYLPDAYKSGAQKFPVLYLLHGAGGNENEWLHKGGVRETMDALIARKVIQPMIVVMPGHTQAWWADGAREKGETALMKEVLPHAEGKYRIDAQRANRMVAGLSAGGHGALNLALKYPQLFAAAAIMSPAIYDPVPPSHSSATRNHPFQREASSTPRCGNPCSTPSTSKPTRPARSSCRCTSTRATTTPSASPTTRLCCTSVCACTSQARSNCASSTATTSGRCGATLWGMRCSS
jgi:poly(3-hydroxybutyrate) depolymerase